MPATRSKPRLVVSNSKPVRNPMSHPLVVAKRYGEAILNGIKSDPQLSSADYFSRESLMVKFYNSAAFGRISTITRYNCICIGVSWLIRQDLLVRPKGHRVNLCLPNQLRRAVKSLDNPLPLHLRYYDHILAMLREFKPGTSIGVMQLVQYWQTEFTAPSLTEDNMRIIIRHAFRHMAKNGLLKENDDYTYTILKALY